MSSANTYLLYHLVFSTKKRQPSLILSIRPSLYAYMGGIIKHIGGMPVIINGTSDHVHILAFLPRHISLSEAVQSIKGGASHWFNKTHPDLHRIHWQEGYLIVSVSGSHLEQVKDYIFNQEEHHRKFDFVKELQQFLNKTEAHYHPREWVDYPNLPDTEDKLT